MSLCLWTGFLNFFPEGKVMCRSWQVMWYKHFWLLLPYFGSTRGSPCTKPCSICWALQQFLSWDIYICSSCQQFPHHYLLKDCSLPGLVRWWLPLFFWFCTSGMVGLNPVLSSGSNSFNTLLWITDDTQTYSNLRWLIFGQFLGSITWGTLKEIIPFIY